jgi:hypothetical protein
MLRSLGRCLARYINRPVRAYTAFSVTDPATLGEGKDPVISRTLVEADIEKGVIAVPVANYAGFNTRICRPVNLGESDQSIIVEFVTNRLGYRYDLKNIIDLARYLLPTPPAPGYMRRSMISLGSGDPTRAICSSLIAQAFQEARYPILPHVETLSPAARRATNTRQILRIRHHRLFAPSDFDISPYFQIIKPTIEESFDYRNLVWGDFQEPDR